MRRGKIEERNGGKALEGKRGGAGGPGERVGQLARSASLMTWVWDEAQSNYAASIGQRRRNCSRAEEQEDGPTRWTEPASCDVWFV